MHELDMQARWGNGCRRHRKQAENAASRTVIATTYNNSLVRANLPASIARTQTGSPLCARCLPAARNDVERGTHLHAHPLRTCAEAYPQAATTYPTFQYSIQQMPKMLCVAHEHTVEHSEATHDDVMQKSKQAPMAFREAR